MSNTVTPALSRRQALSLGARALGAAMVSGSVVPAYATNDAVDLIRRFTDGKWPTRGRVELDLPEIVTNGHTVPLAVSVKSPMTETSHVTDVLVVADGNPCGGVAAFHFSPASGAARVRTRIRLTSAQEVIAVAKMNDGSCYVDSVYVRVALGGWSL